MLSTRPGKRVGFFNTDVVLDLLDEAGTPVAGIVYSHKDVRGTISVGADSFVVEKSTEHEEEWFFQPLIRALTGGKKPPTNPYLLKDATGQVLASAERDHDDFTVSHGAETFSFRKGPSRPYNLYRTDSDEPVGWVGQTKFASAQSHIDLPAGFDIPFQAFLLVLLLVVELENTDGGD